MLVVYWSSTQSLVVVENKMMKCQHFIAQINKINTQHGLTRHKTALLELSAQGYFSNESATVGELIPQEDTAFLATLLAAIQALINIKLLTTMSKEDRRVNAVKWA